MSHLSILRTKLTDRETLLGALRDLGYDVDLREGQKIRAKDRISEVEFSVTPAFSAPIGFKRGKNGYAIVADWFLIQLDRKKFSGELAQRYAYLTSIAQLTQDGFTLVEEKRESDGRIRLTLRRLG